MQDQAALVVEVVVVRDGLVDVAVLLRGARGVELLELEAVVDDRLEEVERADGVRHHGLVRAVPRLVHVRLGAEVEDVGPVRRLAQLADQEVDRRLVREVGEVHLELVPQVTDVVQRAARGGSDEGMNVRAEDDERVGQVGAHEPVGAGHEYRASVVELGEVALQLRERLLVPHGSGSV